MLGQVREMSGVDSAGSKSHYFAVAAIRQALAWVVGVVEAVVEVAFSEVLFDSVYSVE